MVHVSHVAVVAISVFGNVAVVALSLYSATSELAENTEIHTLHYSDKQLTCSSNISVFSVNSFTCATSGHYSALE